MKIKALLFLMLLLMGAPLPSHGSTGAEECGDFLENENTNVYQKLIEYGLQENLIPIREATRVANSPTPIAPVVFAGEPESFSALRDALEENVSTLQAHPQLWPQVQNFIRQQIRQKADLDEEIQTAHDDTNTELGLKTLVRVKLKKNQQFIKAAITNEGDLFWVSKDTDQALIVGINKTPPILVPTKFEHGYEATTRLMVTKQNRLIFGVSYSPKGRLNKVRAVEIFELKNGQVHQLMSQIFESAQVHQFELFEEENGSVSIAFRKKMGSLQALLNMGSYDIMALLNERENKLIKVKTFYNQHDYAVAVFAAGKTKLIFVENGNRKVEVYDPSKRKMLFAGKFAMHLPGSGSDMQNHFSYIVDRKGQEWLGLIEKFPGTQVALINLNNKSFDIFFTKESTGTSLGLYESQIIELESGNLAIVQNTRDSVKISELDSPTITIKEIPEFAKLKSGLSLTLSSAFNKLKMHGSDYWLLKRGDQIYLADNNFNALMRLPFFTEDHVEVSHFFVKTLADGQIRILKMSKIVGTLEVDTILSNPSSTP